MQRLGAKAAILKTNNYEGKLMEMVALILAGIFTVAVIQQQHSAMRQLVRAREEQSDGRAKRR